MKTTFINKIQRIAVTSICGLLVSGLLAAGLISAPVQADGAGVEYYRTISVNSGQVAGTQSNFPTLLRFTDDAGLKDSSHGGHVLNVDGSDIYFTTSDGSARLSFEIEKYDPAAGSLTAWVKVPTLADGSVIEMFYGGAGNSSNQPSAVWDSYFKGVWHMDQSNPSDATVNNNQASATSPNVTANNPGIIGGAVTLDGTEGYIDCGSASSLDFSAGGKYTWLIWVNTSAAGGVQGGQGIVGKSTAGVGGYESYIKNGDNLLSFQNGSAGGGNGSGGGGGGGGAWPVAINAPQPNSWQQIGIVYDNGTVTFYLQGAENGGGTFASPLSDDTTGDFHLGFRRNHNNGNGLFIGSIDEVEYSNIARPADWITTQFNNQNDPASFCSLGVESIVKSNSSISLVSSANPATSGQPVNLTATVSSVSGVPTGQVVFNEGSNVLGTVALSSGSPFTAVLTKSDFTAGSHSLTAAYSGDDYFKGSTAAITQTINAVPSSGGGGGGSYPTTRTVTTSGFSSTASLVTDMQGNLNTAARLMAADGKAVLEITKNTKLASQTGGFLTSLSIGRLTSPPAVPDNTTLISAYNLGPEGAKFNPGVNLTFSYDPAGLPANVMEDNLTIAYYDGTAWQNIAGTVSTAAHTVTATLTHFSSYALLGPLAPPPPPIPEPSPTTSPTPTPEVATAAVSLTPTATEAATITSIPETILTPSPTATLTVLPQSSPTQTSPAGQTGEQNTATTTAAGAVTENVARQNIWIFVGILVLIVILGIAARVSYKKKKNLEK